MAIGPRPLGRLCGCDTARPAVDACQLIHQKRRAPAVNSHSQAWPGFPHVFGSTGTPVSAIIPAYNEAASIGDVLDALLPVAQLSQILVVDDGSDDDTADIVRSHCAV
ncbi:MAG: hypothetical protein DCC55_38550, partial [Chloroflexi bacterium]